MTKVPPLSRRPPTPGKINESAAPSECARMPSSTATAASDNGTRCSDPAFIREAGTRHSRASRSTSPHVAPRASPDRTAVSAVKRIAALAAGPAPDASTATSAAGTSAYGNARRCARAFGLFGKAASITSPAAFTSTWPRACAAASTPRTQPRKSLPVAGLSR